MIKTTNGGFVVVSESGKKLSKVYKSKNAAKTSLHQIEFFKHKKGK